MSENFLRVDNFLALSVANCRDANKRYIINGVTFKWDRLKASFFVDGVQKNAASVYAELSCDYSKLGKVSFVECIDF